MVRAVSRKSLMALASLAAFGAVALAVTEAAAMALNVAPRISPAMSHADSLGGGFGPHTDRIFGPGGGTANPQGFSECYRRAYLRLEKLDSSMGYEFISATARHICGA
jgi:hypothetical protein